MLLSAARRLAAAASAAGISTSVALADANKAGSIVSRIETLEARLSALESKVAPTLAPILIAGPSGVGKGTLINKLMADFPSTFGFSVSHTSRPPRPGEVDGVHYHFSDRDTMAKEIADGLFLESADVHGKYYGTSFKSVDDVADAGKICILDIDIQVDIQLYFMNALIGTLLT
jgi:hypothetical protein